MGTVPTRLWAQGRSTMPLNRNGRRKLLDAHTVATIRRLHAEGDKLSHLAEHFEVSVSCVRGIVRRTTYTEVEDSAADRIPLDGGHKRRPKLSGPLARLAAARR